MYIEQRIKINEMDLCKYTLRKALVDNGKYTEFYNAQEILEESKWKKQKKN